MTPPVDRIVTDGQLMTRADWDAYYTELNALIAKWKERMQARRLENERQQKVG